MSPRLKKLSSIPLAAACIFIGYKLYVLNHSRDAFVWITFTVGLLGLILSVLRAQPPKP